MREKEGYKFISWNELNELTEAKETKADMVNQPSHYADRKYEVIDVMHDTMTSEQFTGYVLGCTIKYIMRWDKKNAPLQDLKKAHWYLNQLITHVEREGK